MPVAFTSSDHIASSCSIRAVYCAGVVGCGSAPSSASALRTSSVASAALSARFNVSMSGRAVIDALSRALNAALASEEVRSRLALEGAEPQPTTPEEYAAIVDRELAMWSELVEAAGIKAE